jgi:hypothetical protein
MDHEPHRALAKIDVFRFWCAEPGAPWALGQPHPDGSSLPVAEDPPEHHKSGSDPERQYARDPTVAAGLPATSNSHVSIGGHPAPVAQTREPGTLPDRHSDVRGVHPLTVSDVLAACRTPTRR